MKPSTLSQGKQRDSNLELYRILVMLLIVAHHYVVNSGVLVLANKTPTAVNAVFLRLFGAWGKTGINCFMLITGYFMCTSAISLKKYAKLFLAFLFYKAILYPVFWVAGYETFSLEGIFRILLPTRGVYNNFLGCFFAFYLLIPFLNILIRGMTKKQHLLLLVLCLTVYTLFSAFDYFTVTVNYVSWFCVLYLVASYVRLHPAKCFSSCRVWGWATVFSLGCGIFSILLRTYTGRAAQAYFYLSDANKPLALGIAFCSFLFFKNLRLPYCRFINTVGGTTFGVLLIHANNTMMTKWLWTDFLQNKSMFRSDYLVIHAARSVLGIFVLCSLIDYCRIRWLETPFFRLWDKKYPGFCQGFQKLVKRLCKLLHIEE